MSPYIILEPHKYFSHIIQIFFMLLGLCKCSLHKPINCHWPSHKYYPQPTYYPTWVFTKILIILLPKLGHKIYICPTQSPTSFGLWAKPKESPKFQKSHYDVVNSKSPTTMWLIQSPTTMWLIPKSHYDVANSKARYNAALFTKPVATRQQFTKSQNHFYKAQILIWHLLFTKPKY